MNSNNTSDIVSILYKIKEEFPYLRIGQIMSNFNDWVEQAYKVDLFYVSDSDYCTMMEQYYISQIKKQTKREETNERFILDRNMEKPAQMMD